MKKRSYALIPVILVLILLAVFAGTRLNRKDPGSQAEYSLSIEDNSTAQSETDAGGTTTGRREETVQTTQAGQTTTTARTTASSAERSAESTSKTKKTRTTSASVTTTAPSSAIDKDGSYTSKEDVALYIHTYGKLPSNFISKKDAQALGWSGGSLEPYAPGKSIGGSSFGNYEGSLPAKKGRKYTECDIDTQGKSSRGAKRIVFSNDGLIYYTGDHYKTFELLYGEE